jgi:hypothetical protein
MSSALEYALMAVLEALEADGVETFPGPEEVRPGGLVSLAALSKYVEPQGNGAEAGAILGSMSL